MLSFLRFEFEKFAVQICSNVVDKNHMEEKKFQSNFFSVCTLTLLVQQSIPFIGLLST